VDCCLLFVLWPVVCSSHSLWSLLVFLGLGATETALGLSLCVLLGRSTSVERFRLAY